MNRFDCCQKIESNKLNVVLMVYKIILISIQVEIWNPKISRAHLKTFQEFNWYLNAAAEYFYT